MRIEWNIDQAHIETFNVGLIISEIAKFRHSVKQ